MQDGVSNLEPTLAGLSLDLDLDRGIESHSFNLADFLEPEPGVMVARQQAVTSFAADQLMDLSPSQLWQFAWLGILAADAMFTAKTAATLWQLAPQQAEQVLDLLSTQQLVTKRTVIQQPAVYGLHDYARHLAQDLLLEEYSPDIPTRLKSLNLTARQAHRILLKRYSATTQKGLWHTLSDDGYIHLHLTWHFQQAGYEHYIHQLLGEEAASGANGWYEVCDRHQYSLTFCKDVHRAWQLAEQLYAQAPTAAIELQCRYALMLASLHRIIENIPPQLIARLVAQQLWSPPQAIAHLELIQDCRYKADLLQALIPQLPTSFSVYLLQAIHTLPDLGDRSRLLSLLAAHFPPLLCLELLKSIQSLPSEHYQALVLGNAALSLPDQALSAVCDLVSAFQDANAYLTAVAGLVTRWPQSIPQVITTLSQISSTPDLDPQLLAQVWQAMALAVEESALSEIMTASEMLPTIIQADIYGLLVPRWPHFLTRAFQLACKITNEWACALALGRLTPHLAAIDLHLCCNILDRFEQEAAKVILIEALSSHITHELWPKLLAQIKALSYEHCRHQALRQVLPVLPDEWRSQAIYISLTLSHKAAKALALTQLALDDSSLLAKAQELIENSSDPITQAEAYRLLAIQSPRFLPQALEATNAIQALPARRYALQQLAPHLPELLLQKTFTSLIRSKDRETPKTLLTVLIPFLSPSTLLQFLALCKNHRDPAPYVNAISHLDTQAPGRKSAQLSPSAARTLALNSLTAYLPEDLLTQSLAATTGFVDDRYRAQTLMQLIPQLHPEQIDHHLWCELLHPLTHLKEADFCHNLSKLMPIMMALGGPKIHEKTIRILQTISDQWHHPSPATT